MSKELSIYDLMPISIETYIPTPTDTEELTKFIQIAERLNIKILVIEGITRDKRDELVLSLKRNGVNVGSLEKYFNEFLSQTNSENEKQSDKFLHHICTNKRHPLPTLIATRKTINHNKVQLIKRQIEKDRSEYELICVSGNNLDVAKWSVHDSRIDCISFDMSSENKIDHGLCSLVKQHNKFFEIALSSLLNINNTKAFAKIIREGKKAVSMIRQHRSNFVLTMHPNNPLELRTRQQLRCIGEMLGIPFNLSKKNVFSYQLDSILRNDFKHSQKYLFDGVEEGNN